MPQVTITFKVKEQFDSAPVITNISIKSNSQQLPATCETAIKICKTAIVAIKNPENYCHLQQTLQQLNIKTEES
jgi:hypothetical protein